MKKTLINILVFVCFGNIVLADTLEIPLYKVAPVEIVDLKCASAEYGVTIGIPERWEIKDAILNFNYVNSSALLKDRSRLVVKFNGYPLAQIELNPIVPDGKAKVSIPVTLIEPGYNEFTFSVSQHYTLECEDPCAPELWTTLKLKEASFLIEYDLKPVPLKLSSIPEFLFDSKIFPHGKVNLIVEDYSSELVTLASIVSSGIALRFDYRKVEFNISRDIKPNYDNILIGKREFVEEFLRNENIEIEPIKKPLLKIMHLPTEESEQDPFHALIVVSGVNLDQVKLASETLAIISFPYPDTDEMIPLKFNMPDVSLYSGRLILTAGKKYTFKTLNFDNHTFKGLNPSPKNITFFLPPDFFVKQNQYANLSLHFAYGAGMRTDSVLNVLLNSKHIRTIRLDNQNGALVEGYELSIPTHLFQAGTNVISFSPVLIPSVASNCEPIQSENLFFTIFSNSLFYFPPMPHFVELPKIELFFLNGFPFTRWPDGHESMIYLARSDPETIVSTLNLVGSITQKNGYPLLAIKISYEEPKDWEGELIVLGTIDDIPKDLKELAPLKLTKKTLVPYPIIRSWRDEKSLAFSDQVSDFGQGKGAIMEYQSPFKEGRSVLLLTANTPKDLRDLSKALLEPAVESKCKGDMNIIDLIPPDYKVFTMDIGKKYYSGKAGKISKVHSYLYSLEKYYYIILILTFVFLGLGIFYILNKYRKKRLKNAE